MLDFLTQKLAKLPNRELSHVGYQPASVLLAVTDEPQPQIILTQRAQNLSTHKGQVAFPGGKCDAEDDDVVATALREAYEEIGLPIEAVNIAGVMGQVYSRHGFIVTPVVGVVAPELIADLHMNRAEIEHVFCVPIDYFLTTKPTMHAVTMLPGFYQVPSFHYKQFLIWGMTAFVLAEFLNYTYDADFPLQQPIAADSGYKDER